MASGAQDASLRQCPPSTGETAGEIDEAVAAAPAPLDEMDEMDEMDEAVFDRMMASTGGRSTSPQA